VDQFKVIKMTEAWDQLEKCALGTNCRKKEQNKNHN
jgi:hypothetical protein